MANWIYFIFPLILALCQARPGPQSSPVVLKQGCRETALFLCVAPVITFVLSADGQRMGKVRKSASFSEQDYNKICRLGQTTIGCMDKWIDKCLPTEQADLHILGNGTVEILAFCSEAGSYNKFLKLTACAEKMNDTHKACGEKLRGALPATSSFGPQSPKALINRENLQKDVCCNIKRYDTCFNKPGDVETICGNEAKSLTDQFIGRIFSAYRCTDAVFASCAGPVVSE